MAHDTPAQSRRGVLALGASAGLVLAGGLPARAQSLTGLLDPRNVMPIHGHILADGMGGNPYIWFMEGNLFLQRPGELLSPMVRYYGAGWNAIRAAGDGNIKHALKDVGYFGDANTGEIIDTWVNPYTGIESEVEHINMLAPRFIAPDGNFVLPPYASDGWGRIGPVRVLGDSLWLEEAWSMKVRLPNDAPPGTTPRLVSPTSSFHASAKQVAAALEGAEGFVEATTAFQFNDLARPWMGFGDTDVMLVWQLYGRKLRSADELPPVLRARAERDHGSYDTPPAL